MLADHFARRATRSAGRGLFKTPMKNLSIIVDREDVWEPFYPTENIITANAYLKTPDISEKDQIVINLSSEIDYLLPGYYCSLLAEARGAKALPSVSCINDLTNFSHYRLLKLDLPRNLEQAFNDGSDTLTAHFCFGHTLIPPLKPLARSLFDRYRAPLMRIKLHANPNWMIEELAIGRLEDLSDAEETLFANALDTFNKKVWRSPRNRKKFRYEMAILYNAEEALPPSNAKAIRQFMRFGKELDMDVETITSEDFGRLGEFDALFIRETTAVNHHTYRFSKRAEHEGLVVIDAPDAILRCTNKVFLKEMLDANDVPTPETKLLFRNENPDEEALSDQLGFPMILKIPDGAFSIGVEKVTNLEELRQALRRLFRASAILLAQEYIPTDFDWRVGILDDRPIFAAKYYMARGHWQIYNHAANAVTNRTGMAEAVGVQHVPRDVIKIAQRASKAIGDGLFGVDIKVSRDRAMVIEVNDNPSIDAGVEDRYLGEELFRIIMGDFVRRLDEIHR